MDKFAFIFPGQSSQRKGMLKELYLESEIVRHTFDEASEIVGHDIAGICFEDEKEMLGDISVSAPIIVAAGVASFRHIVNELQLYPSFMAGHSLGEYTALTCAGVFTLEEALPLVTFRSKIAQKIMYENQGVMSVIYNIAHQEIDEMCRQMRRQGVNVWVSCINSIRQSCIVGRECDVEKLEMKASKSGASYKRIVGNAPYHSPMMEPVVEELAEYIGNCHINAPRYPVICNWSVKPYHVDSVLYNLTQQFIYPVKWLQTIEYFKRQNTNICIELGSGQILSRLMKSTDVDIQSYSYESVEDRRTLSSYLVGSMV
ncbi:Malonyl CoA-acyl carrier protein transacylase [compost metagenome]